MNNIIIWGAGSGLGAAMVDYFHQQGFTLTAISRDPTQNSRINELNISTLTCDATDKKTLQQTVSKLPKGAIHISTMGSFNAKISVDYIGHRHLIDALEQHSASRLMMITSLGCGDSWQYLSEAAKRRFGGPVREKSLAESWLQTSTLDFTILRPGGLKDGAVTHQGELSQHQEVHGLITRSEVARLTYQLLLKKESIGQVYQCVDAGICS
jgi:nucleoside-diphosphate-sugar epimerase